VQILRPKSRDWILSGFFLLSGLLLSAVSGAELYGRWALDGGVAQAKASVTAHEMRPCRGFDCGPPFRLKYRFTTPSGGGPYHFTGQSVFLNTWVRVPSQVWEAALAQQTLMVRYALIDPRVNEPLGGTRYSSFDGWGLMTIALTMIGCAVVVSRQGSRPNKSLERTRGR
jgi:hypothetical protein